LVWIDAAGTRTPIELGGRDIVPYSLALSPDAKRLAVSLREGANCDIWVNDLERGTWLRLTVDGQSQSPLWSPDGARIVFVSGGRERDLYWIASDGSGQPELLAKAGTPELRPTSFSHDGRRLLFAKGRWDVSPGSVGIKLYTMDLTGDREPRVLIDAPYPVTFGAYSPDGRWIALVTQESGRGALDLRASDLTGRRWALTPSSAAWAVGPAWSPSGREVFFQDRDRLMSVPVDPRAGPGAARVVLEQVFSAGAWDARSFELGDGRFLVWQAPPASAASATRPTRVVVIPNWLDEVRARTRPAP
jgi:Tol biopolymer transport system component